MNTSGGQVAITLGVLLLKKLDKRTDLLCIPLQKPFQIIGVDIMDLPVTKSGNRHVAIFPNYVHM